MSQLVLAETTALTARGVAVRTALQSAAAVVDTDAATSALIASGMRVQELLNRVADDVEIAQDMEINSPEMLALAQDRAGRLAAVAGDSGEIERERKQLVAPLNAVVKLINSGYAAAKDHIATQALAPLKGKMLAYDQEQRRLAAEREAKERAERERQAQEAAAREAAANAEAAALLAEAQKAQDAGSDITAQALAQQAAVSVDVVRTEAHAAVQALHTRSAAAPVAKAKGVRGTWKATVTSKDSLILHVAERIKAGDHSLTGLLSVDESAANAKAKLEQNGMNVPGLFAEFTESIAVRRGAL
jgi:hypothetical protein